MRPIPSRLNRAWIQKVIEGQENLSLSKEQENLGGQNQLLLIPLPLFFLRVF